MSTEVLCIQRTDLILLNLLVDQSDTASIGSQMRPDLFVTAGHYSQLLQRLP